MPEPKPKRLPNRTRSVIPASAVNDPVLYGKGLYSPIRILIAMGVHANQVGVLWASQAYMIEYMGCTREWFSKQSRILYKKHYIRKLKPRNGLGYKKSSGCHFTNRVQIMYDGKDTPLPTYEEILQGDDTVIEQPKKDNTFTYKEISQATKQSISDVTHAFVSHMKMIGLAVIEPDTQVAAAADLVARGVDKHAMIALLNKALDIQRGRNRMGYIALHRLSEFVELPPLLEDVRRPNGRLEGVHK